MSQVPNAADQPKQAGLKAENGHVYSKVNLGKETAFAVGNWGESKAASGRKHAYGEIKAEEQARGIVGDVHDVGSATEVLLGKSRDQSRRS